MYQTLTCQNNLIDFLKAKHNSPTPPTHGAGSRTIDAILVPPSLSNVTKAGWLPFVDGVGNHRIAFVDINSEIKLNKDKHEIIPIRARRLQIKKENSVKKYLEMIEPQYCKHNLFQRLNRLRSKTGGDTTIDMIEEIKKIIVLKGEQQCRKINAGKVAYSPLDIQYHGQSIRFWSLVLKKKKHRQISTRLLKRMAKVVSISDHIMNSPQDIIKYKSQEWKMYNKTKKKLTQTSKRIFTKTAHGI